MPKHQTFVDYFTHEFMEELWYLQKVTRGDIPARDDSDPWEKFFNVTQGLLSLAPIPGLPLGFLLSKKLIQVCVKYGEKFIKQARRANEAAQAGYEKGQDFLDKMDSVQNRYESLTRKAESKGMLQQEGPMDLTAMRVVVELIGRGLVERYEHVLSDYLGDPPEKSQIPLARIMAKRLFNYLQSQPLLEQALDSGLLAQRTRLLNGVILGNVDKSWREQLTKKGAGVLPQVVKDMRRVVLSLQPVPKKQLGKLKKFTAEGVIKRTAWYDDKQSYADPKTNWWESKDQPKQPKYGYAYITDSRLLPVDSKPLPAKDYTVPPRDTRYCQPVSLADIQAYLATPEIKAARVAKKAATLSFHDYLHQKGRPAELQAICHEDLAVIKDWSFANFRGVDFSGVKITGNLSGANFSGSYLVAITADAIECHKNHPVSFAQAQLGFANLHAAKLPKADFTQAELQLTNLSHADLTDIQCLGANWYKTDLTGVTRRDLLAVQAKQVAKLQRQFQERMQQLDGRIAKLEQDLVPKLARLEALQKSAEKVAADKAEELEAQITKLQADISDVANNQFKQFCEAELQELREFKKALRDDMDRLNVKVQQHAAEQKAEMHGFKQAVSDDMAAREQYMLRRMDYLLQRQAHYKQHPEEDKSPIDPRYRIPLKELSFSPEDFIASGSVSYIYKVQWQQQTVAVKVFEVSQNEEETAEFVRETAIMGRLRHANVVQFYGACLEENSACLVMEYMEQGSLFDHLAKAGLTPGQQKQIAIDIAKGVHYLHHQGVIHRDLKSGNVLLNKEGHAKLTDFGLSKIQTQSIMSISKKTDAIAWCAPEFLQEGQATPKTDMFSFGTVVWEIFTGKKPFADITSVELTKKILAGEREALSKELPEEIAKLIEDCWSTDPAQRPDAAKALQRLEKYNPADVYYEKAKKLEEAKEYKSAHQYYQSAADLGSSKALANLGMFALKGTGGMPADKVRAYDLLLQAAYKGNTRAMRNLAVMLDTGDGVKQDQSKALEWYEKAGDEASLKRATRLQEKLQIASKALQPVMQASLEK